MLDGVYVLVGESARVLYFRPVLAARTGDSLRTCLSAEVILSYGLLTTERDVCRPAWFRYAFRKDNVVTSNWCVSFSVRTYFA